jgi:signal peptidase I
MMEGVPTSAPDLLVPGPSGSDPRAASQEFAQRLAVRLVVPLALILTALVLVFFVFFRTSTVAGSSMYPTLHDHDLVLATPGLRDPKRGDIVILNVVWHGGREEWVKRIVAIGGDTVDVMGDIIRVNGAPEQFPHMIINSGETSPVEHLVVPQGRLFVAGDNRGISEDSRYVGTFSASAVRGKVVAIYAPIGRIGLVPGP